MEFIWSNVKIVIAYKLDIMSNLQSFFMTKRVASGYPTNYATNHATNNAVDK